MGEYAFVRPAREMLFSRVDNETKYKAKNVIDVPVYRGADALSAQVNTAITNALAARRRTSRFSVRGGGAVAGERLAAGSQGRRDRMRLIGRRPKPRPPAGTDVRFRRCVERKAASVSTRGD